MSQSMPITPREILQAEGAMERMAAGGGSIEQLGHHAKYGKIEFHTSPPFSHHYSSYLFLVRLQLLQQSYQLSLLGVNYLLLPLSRRLSQLSLILRAPLTNESNT